MRLLLRGAWFWPTMLYYSGRAGNARELMNSRPDGDSYFGLDCILELIKRAMALPLIDRYWARPAGSDVAWDDVNVFDNDFSSEFGELSIDPIVGPRSGSHSGDDLMAPNSTIMCNVPK